MIAAMKTNKTHTHLIYFMHFWLEKRLAGALVGKFVVYSKDLSGCLSFSGGLLNNTYFGSKHNYKTIYPFVGLFKCVITLYTQNGLALQ